MVEKWLESCSSSTENRISNDFLQEKTIEDEKHNITLEHLEPTFERLSRKVVMARMNEIVAQKLCTPRTSTRVRLV